MSIVACTPPAPARQPAGDLARVERWWIVIGASPVLESARLAAPRARRADGGAVGRSAHPDRRSFPRHDPARLPQRRRGRHRAAATGRRCSGQPFLVEPNPDWPGNMPRRPARPALAGQSCCAQEMPRLMALGFDGLMLDTIDTAPYLEKQGPGAVRGLAAGAARLAARRCASASRARSRRERHEGAGRRRALRRRLRRRGRVRDLRLWPAHLPRHDRRRTGLEAGRRSRARGGRAAPGVHHRIRRHRRRHAVTLGADESRPPPRLSPLRRGPAI